MRFTIHGGRRLAGLVSAQGAKNAVLPLMAASLLTMEPVTLHRCPPLLDVLNMEDILVSMGAEVVRQDETLVIDPSSASLHALPESVSREMRSSIFLLGSILSRFGQAECAYPGGCEIGLRPIDLHLKALREMGVEIEEEGGMIRCKPSVLTGARIHLDYPSVGATENVILAAARAKGMTVLYNAACEPEVADLAGFINAMGGKIRGAGTSCLEIEGVETLHGTEYTPIPDRIEAGTWLMAGAITRGNVEVQGIHPEFLLPVLNKLRQMGCEVGVKGRSVTVSSDSRLMALPRVDTMPFPGFPTDLQPPIFALATLAQGTTTLVENVFENRFRHAGELIRMGAKVTIHERVVAITGVEKLYGAPVTASDLRAGAALVLAGLAAEGETQVYNLQPIDRGYWKMEDTLSQLGGDIIRE